MRANLWPNIHHKNREQPAVILRRWLLTEAHVKITQDVFSNLPSYLKVAKFEIEKCFRLSQRTLTMFVEVMALRVVLITECHNSHKHSQSLLTTLDYMLHDQGVPSYIYFVK